MNLRKVKVIRIFPFFITAFLCSSSFIVATLLLFNIFDVPLSYQIVGSFYSNLIMKDLHEWIFESSEIIEYIWICLFIVYVYGKSILVFSLACVFIKKPLIGVVIVISFVMVLDIFAWIYTVIHLKYYLYWTILGVVMRGTVVFGYIYDFVKIS